MAGIYLQISFFVAAILLIPVVLLWSATGPVLKWMGNEEKISNDAWYFAMVLSVALPARIIMNNVGGYFQGQKIVHTSYYTTMIGCGLNLVLGLWLVLGFYTNHEGYGFSACPIVTAFVQWVMVIYVVVWFVLI